jgi:hypothetical protein
MRRVKYELRGLPFMLPIMAPVRTASSPISAPSKITQRAVRDHIERISERIGLNFSMSMSCEVQALNSEIISRLGNDLSDWTSESLGALWIGRRFGP